ncbi:MAG: DUF3857 and transglutaminase domain-containing protein [Acidobacteria bacterium]|nr:DUF3857 and transglutaminase domain-containing protein [Acidobacteriota bacterium]
MLPATQRRQSRVLSEVRVDELGTDYKSRQHVQRIIAVGIAADISSYTIPIEYSRDKQKLTLLRAHMHRPDGRVGRARDLGESSPGGDNSEDSRVHSLAYQELRGGEVLELEYELTPVDARNPYGAYFAELVAFGGSLPSDLQRYILRVPKSIAIASSQSLLDAPENRTSNDENLYIWQKTDLPALVRAPRSPSWSEQGAFVHVSNFGNWQELGKWYAELLRRQFDLNAELSNVAASLTTEHANRLDRVAATYELVLKKTHYASQESGIHGFKPYPVSETYSRGYGDCKDTAALIVALLRATGIEAEMALVRTRELGQIVPTTASASIFDHAVVYVPEFELWLDGTAEFARLREVPVEDQGAMALTIDSEGNATLRQIPLSTTDDNYSRRTINARLESDGTIHFSGATYVRGEDAPELRRQLQPGESKMGFVRQRLEQVFPAVEVKHVELPDAASEFVSLGFDGDLLTYRGKHSVSLPISWMQRNYVESLSPETSRTQDLRLDVPWTTEEEIHIALPAGANVAKLPENQSIRTSFGLAELAYRVTAGEITVVSKVQFSGISIPSVDYERFRAFNSKIETAFASHIQIDLP